MDPVTLATTAVAALSPYLVKMGESAAEKVGESSIEGAGKLLGWIKSKLTGRAQEALTDLVAAPADADNKATLRVQIRKALEADPALAEELATLLASVAPSSSDTVSSLAIGPGAKSFSIKGNDNKVNM